VSFDYLELMEMSLELNNKFEDVKEIYKRMCFNVFACNMDSNYGDWIYMYNKGENCYRLAPAIDLTYAIKDEWALGVNGNRNNPSLEDILKVAKKIGMDEKSAKETPLNIKYKCEMLLKNLGLEHPYQT
jgi:serine/threonine-protein kinase HipA